MPDQNPPTARRLAFDVLQRAARTGTFATELLDESLDGSRLSPADRRLATELVYGVVRRQGTLGALLRPCLTRAWEKVETDLQILLQLGCYQLVLMTAIPQHAAVHETAELTKQISRPQWTGFVNGVLRTLSRMVTDTVQSFPAANAVPLSIPDQYRLLTSPLFPQPKLTETRPDDAASKLVAYFSPAFGFPQWLSERWALRFAPDELLRLGFWWNSPPGLCLRVNRLKTSRDAFVERLAVAEISTSPGAHPDAVWLNERRSISIVPGFDQGEFSVQDESAMSAASLLAPQPGETVLDLCAAPGGKTTHLAELMSNCGRIVAVDVDARRVGLICDNCRRLGISIVSTAIAASGAVGIPEELFDAALVDVPCSNTGVLGKRAEARFRLRPDDLVELPRIQHSLLSAAMQRIKPGGRVVYSTCSIEPEENRQLVETVLAAHPGWKWVRELTHVPGRPADGGYQALLSRE